VSLYFGAYSRRCGCASVLRILNTTGSASAQAADLKRAYNVIMKLELVRIGNSRGIRIPKPIIDQLGFEKTVTVRIERDRLVITPERRPRQGWAETFEAAGSSKDDELLFDSGMHSDFDRKEWEW
jgi:antitoxin MazE